MKLNKTNLNKIIKWTSSKFNVWTKKEVINMLLNMVYEESMDFACGSYGENAWNGGYHYYAEMHRTYLYIQNKNAKEEHRLYK